MYHICYIHSFVEEYLDCFQFLAIMNLTAMYMFDQLSSVRMKHPLEYAQEW